MRTYLFVAATTLLLLPGTASAQQSQIPAPVRAAANVIQQSSLKRDVDFLAADALRGRETPSPGLDSAAAYVARRLAAMNLAPAGDNGTYRQHYTIRSVSLDTTNTWLEVGGRRITFGNDLLVQNFVDSLRLTAPMVYVGHGIQAPKKAIDPYAGLDLRGKIVIAHGPGAYPAGETFASLGTPVTDWSPPSLVAPKLGAVALILIVRPNSVRRWDFFRSADWLLNSTEMDPIVPSAFAGSSFPSVMLKPEQLETLLGSAGGLNAAEVLANADRGVYPASFQLDPARMATLNVSVSKTSTQRPHNVVARIEGSDPLLRGEAVVIMAHLDGAVGPPPPGSADSIFNAADDNASGSAGILAVAEAMLRAPRPKRSVIFVWDTGEEVGLWGSRYFAANPPVPLRDVIAHFNVDMIGRSKAAGDTSSANEQLAATNEIHVVGPRVLSTEVDSLIHRTNRALTGLQLNHRFDLASHEFFYPRTDAGPMIERGVLIIDFADGIHEDYHEVGDESGKLDLAKMEKVARLIFATAWQLADGPVRPKIDKGIPASVPRYPPIQP